MAKKVGTLQPDAGAPKGKKLSAKQLNINKGSKVKPNRSTTKR